MSALTLSIVLCTLLLGAFSLSANHLIYALPLPANHTITTKLTDTLKSITSNVSASIQSDIDKVISDTMDITINNVMSQLSNATILGNNDASSIDLSGVSLPVSNEFASLEK
jgi:proline dehydrogenase